MLKKSMLALVVLVGSFALAVPKANAQVSVGVMIGRPAVVAPAPVVVAPAPYAYAPAPAGVWISGRWYPRAYGYRRAYWGPRHYYRPYYYRGYHR